MADKLKQIAKGTLTSTIKILYTTPADTTTILKSIILSNNTISDVGVTIKFDGVNIVPNHTIYANDSLVLQLTAVLENGQSIEGLAGVDSAVDFYISGIEVS